MVLRWKIKMPVITALEVQKRNKDRVNIYLDDEFAFGLPIMEAAKLRKGQTLTEAEIDALTNEDAIQKAVDRAIDYLSYRPRSTREVRQNLVKKEVPEPVIEIVIGRLERLGYLDDIAFARFWIENRDNFKPMSPRALRYELRQKGIEDNILDPLLDEIVDVHEAAYRAIEKRKWRFRGKTRQEFKHKLSGTLQRRGFYYGVINDVIQQLMDELVEDDPDYFAYDGEE